MVITIIFALFASLLFESPFIGLEKLAYQVIGRMMPKKPERTSRKPDQKPEKEVESEEINNEKTNPITNGIDNPTYNTNENFVKEKS